MKESSRSRLALALLCGLAFLNAFVWLHWPPGHQLPRQIRLEGPYLHEAGHAFVVNIPVKLPSDAVQPQASHVELYEQGILLGPAHVAHEVIRKQGNGGFSHWRDQLYFSASDNSDPNTNGRTYHLHYGETLPLLMYVLIVGFDYLLVMFWLDQLLKKRFASGAVLTTGLRVVEMGIMTFLLIQVTFWVLTQNAMANQSQQVQKWFNYSLHKIDGLDFAPGESINFSEHQYLNYVLNPDMPYGEAKQFNAEYRIRRTEPIRSREIVRWRALVLGGSTTFGELIRHEEETWVAQLERRVRERCGGDCDVINGGIGGYTVLENLIHYLVLLEKLQPDVVLLYEGINDVDARLFGTLVSDYSNYRIPWRSQGSVLQESDPKWSWLYPYQYYFLFQIVRIHQMGIGGVVSPPRPPLSEWAAALERNGPDVYHAHLRSLIQLLHGQRRYVVILPQHFTVTKEGDDVFMTGVQQHNAINKKLAEEFQSPFLDKLMTPTTFDREDTFDNCHFNERGSIKMAEEVFQFLVHRGLLKEKNNSSAQVSYLDSQTFDDYSQAA